MSRIPEQFIDEVLNRVDVVEIIDSRVKLRKTGKNYSACCPFHKEKTPSFSVSPDKQFYYCFGCGASGTALSFLMDYEHLSFLDAVESLASSAGLKVPKEQQSTHQKSHKNLYTILEKSQQFYEDQLKQHPARQAAVSYLKNRGLSGEIVKKFGVGYAPPGWDNLLAKLGISDEDRSLLDESGMITVNEDSGKRYDRFRDRIMFPIIDVRGRTIAFGGRVLASETQALQADGKKKAAGPKYLNSPETPVFHKGREFYGLYQALKSGRKLDHLLVVEGYMDVIALAQYGIDNAVATMGTACGEDHLKLGFRYTNQIIFCFDGDNAGRKAAKRALENSLPAMIDGRQIKFQFLPEGQDPDSLVRQIGTERFQQQLKSAIPLETFFFESVAEGIDVRTMEGRARMSKMAAPLLNTLPNGVYRELMFDFLAQRTGLSFDILQELMKDKVSLVQESATTKPQSKEKPLNDDPLIELSYDSSYDASYDSYEKESLASEESYISSAPPRQDKLAFAEHTHYQESKSAAGGKVKMNPVRLATALLLDDPSLLASNGINAELPDTVDNQDFVQLKNLLEYLKDRPKISFPSIWGYWGGHYGVEAQKRLADIVAVNEFLNSAKRTARYDSSSEFISALDRIRLEAELNRHASELAKLTALAELTGEQKKRYIELLQLKQTLKLGK